MKTNTTASCSPFGLRRTRRLGSLLLPLLVAAWAATLRADPPLTTGDAVVKMDPFETTTSADKGYSALNSNSITAFGAEMDKLPITADILDQAFIKDVGAETGSLEDMIKNYSAGAGTYTPDAASTAAQQQPGDRNGTAGFALRGLDAVTVKMNGFMNAPIASSGYTSLFDIERVEIVHGPQSLLYGTSGPGGVINEVSKQARLGGGVFGSTDFRFDQYGNKLAQVDFGAGTDAVAVRFAAVRQDVGGRRVGVGGPLDGQYLQFAFRVSSNTIIRLQAEQSVFQRGIQTDPTVLIGSTAVDSRSGDNLHYLLATNQINAAASGPSGGGAIDNGNVNWGNVDSFDAWYESQKNINDFESLNADTRWSDWLSTQLNVGYNGRYKYRPHNSNALMLLAPLLSSNPLNSWAMGTKKNNPIRIDQEPDREKAVRFSAVATNDLFGGKAHSQTIFGGDFDRVDDQELYESYFLADSNFNPVIGTAAANNGRTAAPLIYWPVANGPIAYPFFAPGTPKISLNGNNYVEMPTNEVDPTQKTLINPRGTTLGGATNTGLKDIEKGVYAVNYTDWMDGKLETLVGFRLHNSYNFQTTQGFAPPAAPGTVLQVGETFLGYNLGVDYKLSDWLRPYASFSSSYSPPPTIAADPDGNPPKIAHSIGEEVGLKLQSPDGRFSGSLALYHADSKNEQYIIPSTLLGDINPSGLNGAAGAEDAAINVNRESSGIELNLTAAPTPDWRLRFGFAGTDGTVESDKTYGQLYNDQFYENSAGQVTYADGTLVYVNPTFNSKQVVATSTTAGAVPLTIAALNTPSSPYYAAAQPVTGALGVGTNLVSVLSTVDPVHGAILTGRTGLPISAIQISPAANGVVVPGSITVAQSGETTVGYPKLSINFTAVYTLPTGWAKGLRLGGTFQGSWDYADFFYLSNPALPNRSLFKLPIEPQFNGIVGYERRFHRVTWSTQLNVYNMFNHYKVVLIPGELSGYTSPSLIEATFTQQPRSYVWSNTISF